MQALRYLHWRCLPQHGHVRMEKDFPEGLALAADMQKVPAHAKEAFSIGGNLLQWSGKYEDAIPAYQQADSPPQTLLWTAECLAKLGKLDPAVSQLREVENFFKDSASDAALRTAYLYRDEPEAAIRAFYSMMACAFSHHQLTPLEHRWAWGQYYMPPSTDGAWFELYRNMLVNELSGDGTLFIGQAVPRAWLADGKIIAKEDVVDGLEAAPAALTGLLEGKNFGKLIVRVASDDGLPLYASMFQCGTSVKAGHCLLACANLIEVLSIFARPGLYLKCSCRI